MSSRSLARFLLPIVLGLSITVGLLISITLSRQTSTEATIGSNEVILEDFSDIVTRVDQGFNDFSGNMGIINDGYGEMALNCANDDSCALRFEWDFRSAEEAFTGFFFSLFGLLETRITKDVSTTERISFPEHYLDFDRIDGALDEPGGPRRLLTMCVELTYTQTKDLKLRVELKDVQEPDKGARFTRLDIQSSQEPQQLCWDFRNPSSYSKPADSADFDIRRAKELTLIVERKHTADGVENPVSGWVDFQRIWFNADRAETQPGDDQQLLDLLERRTYQYFLDWSSRKSQSLGIAQDRSTFGDLLTVGGTGFGLPAHVIAADRGWISRTEAASRTLSVLRVLDNPNAFGHERIGRIGYKGWFYHFLGVDGRRRLNFDFPETPGKDEALNTVELSTIDTGLVMMGALAAQSYFTKTDDPTETEIRRRVQAIYDRVDWSFMLEPTSQQFYLGWKPNEPYEGPPFEIIDDERLGKYSGVPGDPATLDFYTDEALIVILLATGAITDPVPIEAYTALDLRWQDGLIATWPGALFTYQFFHAFFDARTFLPRCPSSWFENSREAILRAIEYAETNPRGFAAYGSNAYGISAAEGPFDDYHAYGAPPLAWNPEPEEDGTVTYYAMLSAASFGDDLRQRAISALRAAWQRGQWHPRFALPDAFNGEIAQAVSPTATVQTVPTSGSLARQSGPWVQRALFAIDQGPMLLHLENARSGLIWDLVAQNPNIQRALERLAAFDKVSLEAEAGIGDGQIMPRSQASGQQTVHLMDGEMRTIPFSVRSSARYSIGVRYSNDNFGPLEEVRVSIDGAETGSFSAQDTGDFGLGWNVFTSSESLGPVDLAPGLHTLQVAVEGGDGSGVEIDVVLLEVSQCFFPSLRLTKGAVFRPMYPEAVLTYTIQVINTGNITLAATLTDILPDHVTPTGILTWTAAIPSGGIWTETVTVAAKLGLCRFVNNLQITTKEGVMDNFTEVTEPCTFLPTILKNYGP